jgi:hypothetical protein
MIREARKGGGRRIGAGVTVLIAIATLCAGFAIAQGFLPTNVIQRAAYDQGQTVAPTNFPTAPALAPATSPTSTCTNPATAQTAPSGGGTLTLTYNATGGTTCSNSDFAELWTYTSAAATTAGNDRFTFVDQFNTGAGNVTGSVSIVVTTATPATSSWTLNVYVDYGVNALPQKGIWGLDVMVTGV